MLLCMQTLRSSRFVQFSPQDDQMPIGRLGIRLVENAKLPSGFDPCGVSAITLDVFRIAVKIRNIDMNRLYVDLRLRLCAARFHDHRLLDLVSTKITL